MILETAYKPLLQGMSQQVPRERLDGQVSDQVNMLSDLVTGLRRRPGCRHEYTLGLPGDTDISRSGFARWFGTVGPERLHVWIDTNAGRMIAWNGTGTRHNAVHPYFQASSRASIRFAALDDALYVLNVEKPLEAEGTYEPQWDARKNAGFIMITVGALNTEFGLTLAWRDQGDVYWENRHTYMTPDGTNPGDANLATPQYIANRIVQSINDAHATGDPFQAVYEGGTIFVYTNDTLLHWAMFNETPIATVRSSGNGTIASENLLPTKMPSGADGLLVRVGKPPNYTYYRWEQATGAWLEAPAPGSVVKYTGGPVRMDGNFWSLMEFEGRLSGDDDNNPAPMFLEQKRITGIGSFQGRLVLLCDSRVAMSASRYPPRFFRSTVLTIPDDDPIEIGTTAASAARFEHAVQFERDLVVFSQDYQAVVPGGNAAVTPRTATIVLASQYSAMTDVPPTNTGRTLMFPFRRDMQYWGFREMVASPYTDNQYISVDATQHIPRIIEGVPRFVDIDTGNSKLVAGSSTDPNVLLVQEYLWTDTEKVQQSWHRFRFPFEVLTAYFADSLLYVMCVARPNAQRAHHLLQVYVMNLQAQWTREDASTRPFLDLRYSVAVDPNTRQCEVPEGLWGLLREAGTTEWLGAHAGFGVGDAVGFTIVSSNENTATLQLESSYEGAFVWLGARYESSVTPTPPMLKDEQDIKINTAKATVQRYYVSTANSSEYRVELSDSNYLGSYDSEVGPLTWSSRDLALGRARVAGEVVSVVPARTLADSTLFRIYTTGSGELNILGLEYLLRTYQRRRRI